MSYRYVVKTDKGEAWGVRAHSAEDALTQARLLGTPILVKPYQPTPVEGFRARQPAGIDCLCHDMPELHVHFVDPTWEALQRAYDTVWLAREEQPK